MTPDGAFVYVANGFDDTVSVIDTSDNTVIDTVTVGGDPVAFGIFIGLLFGGGGGGGCSIAGGPVRFGTEAANTLITLLPAFAIGFRMLLRRKEQNK